MARIEVGSRAQIVAICCSIKLENVTENVVADIELNYLKLLDAFFIHTLLASHAGFWIRQAFEKKKSVKHFFLHLFLPAIFCHIIDYHSVRAVITLSSQPHIHLGRDRWIYYALLTCGMRGRGRGSM